MTEKSDLQHETVKRRGRKAKSSFYHTRWNKVGLNEQRAAEVLDVTVEDVKRFDDEGNPLAEKVLMLWDKKHVGITGWEGFLFSQGVLKHKGRRWTPRMLLLEVSAAYELHHVECKLRDCYTWKGLAKIAKTLIIHEWRDLAERRKQWRPVLRVQIPD